MPSLHSKIKTLVIVYGQLRGSRLAWDSMERYLLEYYKADLAIIGPPDSRNEIKHLKQRAKYIWTVPEYSDWGDVFMNISQQDISWKKLCSIPRTKILGGVNNCEETSTSSAILLTYRYHVQQNLIHEVGLQTYDWIILTRSDYDFLCSPPSLEQLNMNRTLYIPNGEGYGGYTDRFAIFPSEYATAVLNITQDLILSWKIYFDWINSTTHGRRNIEALLKYYLDERVGIQPIQFQMVGFTVRAENDPTRWFSGSDHEGLKKYGLKVKYPDELITAVQACPEGSWNQHEQWNSKYIIPSKIPV